MKHLFCFGLGYSALLFAQKLQKKGWVISGTCRSKEKASMLKKLGINAYIFDSNRPIDNIEKLSNITHILHSIPPSENPLDIVYSSHIKDLEKIKSIKWVGYLSTTGVYGDHQGNWVDEDTAPTPPAGRSTRRKDAENMWLGSNLPIHIFRLSGIYGPGRNILVDLKNNKAHRIYKENQVFSRIHVEDISNILECSIDNLNPGRIYNCADDLPAPQHEVVEYGAKLINITPPTLVKFADAELSIMAKSFWQNNRRVRNARIKKELSVNLIYQDYKSGLLSIAKQDFKSLLVDIQ